jgi:hypothetical protein
MPVLELGDFPPLTSDFVLAPRGEALFFGAPSL